MFNKKIFAAGKDFMIYQKDSEIDTVCIQVDEIDFEVSKHQATIILPIEIWETIRQISAIDLSFRELTDEQLFERVSREVDERLSNTKRTQTEERKRILRFPSSLKFTVQ